MKKLLSLILILALTLSLGVTAFASNGTKDVTLHYREIKIVVNGRTINPTDAAGKAVEPFIIDGTTYLPVRAVADALGLSVAWDESSSTITLTSGGEIVARPGTPAASSGSKAAAVTYRDIKLVLDGKAIEPTDASGKPVEPFIIDGTTYLPVRAVSGALGLEVAWDEASSTITLTSLADEYLLSRQTVTYTYEAAGISFTSRSSDVYTYDEKGQIICLSTYADDELQSTVSYTYDSQGRTLSETYDDGSFTTYEYSDDGSTVTETAGDADGILWISVYVYTVDESAGTFTVTEKTTFDDSESYTDVTVYDDWGNILSSESTEDGSGYIFRQLCTYDEYGISLTETYSDSDGYSYSISYTNSYDANGNLISQKAVDTDGASTLTRYSYDTDGYLVKVVENDGYTITTTSIAYENGLPVEIRIVYDGMTVVVVNEYVPFRYGD